MSTLETSDTMCPVCTLYLRPGITLKQHLASHPKQKVIDALVKLSLHEEPVKSQITQQTDDVPEGDSAISQTPNQPSTSMPPYFNQIPVGNSSSVGPTTLPGNHFFMYQQSMSTSSPHQPNVSAMTFNPFAQQYLVPAVYNAQMMPYFYQQQQLIMSSNGIPPHIKALPFESSTSGSQVLNRPLEVVKEKHAENTTCEKLTESDQDGLNSQGESRSSEDDDEVEETEQPIVSLTINDPQEPEASTSYKEEEDQEGVINLLEEDENSSDRSYQPPMYQEHNEEYQAQHEIDHEECVGTPLSHSSNADWAMSSDLNKACQTQTNNSLSPRSSLQNEEHPQTAPEYFFIDQRSNVSVVLNTENVASNFDQAEAVYNSSTILNNSEGVDFMNVEDIEGMQVILGDFTNATIIPQESFDPIRQNNSPPIVMAVSGENSDGFLHIVQQKNQEMEESCLDNVNIRSDEKMPPRGELSGQESMGSASDLTWNQIQHYQDQDPMCYEQNSWDSTSENPLVTDDFDTKEIQTSTPGILKQEDVKENVMSSAPKQKRPKLVSLDVGRSKPRKLLIKPKRPKKESQTTSFNNVFSNKLKTENSEGENFENFSSTGQSVKQLDEIKEEKVSVDMCKECDKIFKTKKELRMHNLEFHKITRNKSNKCQICNEVFDAEHKFTEHLKIHPLECHICGKLFFRRQGLKLHIARHEGIKPHKCDLCDKAFLVKQKLEEHRNCHTGNAPIKCSLCPETFKRHSNLVQHRNRHHFFVKKKVKDYVCFCGEVFHSKKKFAWHSEKHDTKPKSCTQCSEKFVHMAGLTRHMRRAHNAEYLPDGRDPNTLNRVCPICKGVYLKSSMEAHLQTHGNNKPYACSMCSKKFTTKWNLKLHKWTHAPRTQKPFKCSQCKGAFIRENDYIAHMNSHKSVRPYTCNYCGAQFIRKYNCQRHVKEHENQKAYVCNVCEKSFHRSYYLKDHMRVHTGHRPYACHICGKTSTTKSNHNKHIQIHHAREPVSTEN
ncbi:hypothetical protein GWI33_009232 [Rhynchophorus ferrugineus]|uniref:C2H2-type domain-containing protein n=1 Tax=Rhynchophorus ferrugineus TaxID=354439 RepID=A0A834MFE9_RHYFE|nr:hypothetical protein GWI33_009232 [Rhynchophorus ferrugineus]